MTQTGRWLAAWRAQNARREFGTAVLWTGAASAVAASVGVLLGRVGLYQIAPIVVVPAWLGVVAAILWGVGRYRRVARLNTPYRLAALVERLGGLRRGSVGGVAEEAKHGSPALMADADRRTSIWLNTNGQEAVAPADLAGARSFRLSALAGVLGLSLFTLSGPGSGRAASFWHPVSLLAARLGAVTVTVDREEIQRGESVVVAITAPGSRTAELWKREPGEPWSTTPIDLDSTGQAATTVGPLTSDLFLRAVSGRRSSNTVQVRVALPAFLSDLVISVRYPTYLELPDEPLFAGDSVFLPVGTRLNVRGRATVPLRTAAWVIASADTSDLETDGNEFSGQAIVRRGGEWELVLSPIDRPRLEDPNPVLHVVAVPDSAPEVSVPIPGADTTIHVSLRQLLVVDARDDHRLSRVEITSRRVTPEGSDAAPVTDTIPLPAGGTDRAVLQWVLDLNDRGFLPGDTAYYRIRVFDNAPTPQSTATREFALRLPSVSDMRQAVRDAAEELVTDADSLLRAQQALAEETENLAASGDREGTESGQGRRDANERMDFRSAEEAAEIGEEQTELLERAQELVDQLQELAESGWDAGITDPEWHKRLVELQEMLEQAVTPDMEELLEQLQQAIEQLDAQGVQELLEQLAEAQERALEQLERSRELLERAAIEGAMTTLADDAEDLADRQEDWNEAVEEGQLSDSTMATDEQALAGEAERLERQLSRVQEAMNETGNQGDQLQQSQTRAGEAASQMRQASQQVAQGQQQQAQQSGQSAGESLEPIAEDLREQLEQMRQQWRDEVLGMMDAALIETADMAERQEAVTNRLERGESGADVRGAQAAIREGVDKVIERLQGAAGKNALVSPELGTALGFSRLKMTEVLDELQESTPNARQAGDRAGQALDGLNELAYALLRNRSSVEGAESGSGMAEAMEQMAQMAQEQQSMASESGNMLPMMASGQELLLQQLMELAARQRELGEELERMDADGAPTGTEEMAEEALEVARQLEAGQLDRETVERQERLFRRLLDAGRTLRSEEEDEREEERISETADQTDARRPPELDADATGSGARFPYPGWEQLRRFTPSERRLILDYFRRLNEARRRP